MGSARRLFLALWPGDELRQTLAQATRRAVRASGGRPVRVENLHLTLFFLGATTPDQERCLVQALAAMPPLPGFTLRLDHFGCFPRARVLWLAPREVPQPALALGLELNRRAGACAFRAEPRPFRPHLTLARKVAHGADGALEPPLLWRVHDFCLVESKTYPDGPCYQVRQRWPLATG